MSESSEKPVPVEVMKPEEESFLRYILTAAAIVIVIAGIKAAKPLIAPFLLALFFAIILTPLLHWLEAKRIRTFFALSIIFALVLLVGAGLVAIVGNTVGSLSAEKNLNKLEQGFRKRVQTLEHAVRDALPRVFRGAKVDEAERVPHRVDSDMDTVTDNGAGDDVSGASAPSAPAESTWLDGLNIKWSFVMDLVRRGLSEAAGLLSNALVIIVTVIFMLLEAPRFPDKLNAIVGRGTTFDHTDTIVANVRGYMVIKTITSLLTGILIGLLMRFLDPENYLFWGLLAFLFNYIPNIGSILAAVPAVLLVFVSDNEHYVAYTLATVIGYVAVNCLISFVIEPRFMGQGLGLSTLVVFLSLVFWGWVMGPVGMFFSAPLTMILKIVLEGFEETRWIAIMMGAKAPESPQPVSAE